MRNTKYFLELLLLCCLFSCSNHDVVLTDSNVSDSKIIESDSDVISNIVVNQGVLCFETWADFTAFSDIYYENYRDNWVEFEINKGFYSQESYLEELNSELDEIETKIEFEEFLGKYGHLFQYRDSMLTRKVKHQFLNSIANSEGYYCIDNQLFRIYDGFKISYQKEKNLEDALQSNIVIEKETLDNNLLKSMQIACGNYKSAHCGGDYDTSNAPDRNKRKVFLECHAEKCCPNGCSSLQGYSVRIYVYGMRKKWFGWDEYKTSLSFKDMYCKMRVPDVTGQNGNVSVYHFVSDSIWNVSENTGDLSQYNLEKTYEMGEQVLGVNLDSPYFTMIQCKASSRGVGEYCADVDCGTAY